MGIGGGPEGVITAAAMKCLNGEIQARFVMKEQLEMAEDRAKIADGIFDRMQAMGVKIRHVCLRLTNSRRATRLFSQPVA